MPMTEQAPLIKGEIPGPEAKKIIERDSKSLVTSTKSGDLVVRRAKGSLIEDVDGNVIIDLYAGIGVHNVGHCHPEVVRAIKEQAEMFTHIAGTDFYYDIQVALAEKLIGLCPGKDDRKVFFANSGAESVEAAIKVAKAAKRRHNFIGFLNAFHGRTLGALAITASKPVQKEGFFPFMPGVCHIPYANCYRCRYHLTYPSCDLWCAKILDEIYFQSFVPPEDVAAIFAEPVQGEGGYIVPPKEFLPEIKKITEKYGILFVDDEVQAGIGRTGKFWAIEHFGVVPDMITSAKALGSGVPIGALIIDAALDFRRKGMHSNTYGGNPIAAAAAIATLKVIEDEKLIQRASMLGERSLKRLREMQEDYEIVGDTRGLGLMLAHEFVRDEKSKAFYPEARNKVEEVALKKGLALLGAGRSSIRYIPPLNIEEELLDMAWEILDDSIKHVNRERP